MCRWSAEPFAANTHTFEVQGGEFVQILNLGGNHWITISTVGCMPAHVQVFDSMHMELTSSVKKTIADLLQTTREHILVEHMDIQFQSGGSDCGLFAIASATALCHGQNPVHFRYEQSSMRKHLMKALEMKALHPFPAKKKKKDKGFFKRERLPVHCKCRLPDDGRQMILCSNCKNWYHVDCVRVPTKVLKSTNRDIPWFCKSCK